MISDREWLRKLGEWKDWEDESYGERLLREDMRMRGRQSKMYLKSLMSFQRQYEDRK